jgi:hypothetical protein
MILVMRRNIFVFYARSLKKTTSGRGKASKPGEAAYTMDRAARAKEIQELDIPQHSGRGTAATVIWRG